MATGRQIQLTKQVGEYLVAAELSRQGLLTATFAGNVPAYGHCQVADERAFFSLGAERPSLGQQAHVTSSH